MEVGSRYLTAMVPVVISLKNLSLETEILIDGNNSTFQPTWD